MTKSVREIEDKLEEALNTLDAIPEWDTDERSACEGTIAALTWVLGGLDNMSMDGEDI
jgi:hypothetical protein